MRTFATAASSLLLASCLPNLPMDEPQGHVATTEGFVWPGNLDEAKVLFVGAHPDDELGVAPLLADACLNRGARCHFIVAADANSPGCLLTIGMRDFQACSKVRRQEMIASAKLFDGTVEFLGFDDLFYSHNSAGVQRVIKHWSQQAGGREALVTRFERVLLEQQPKVIFALDPRHGSSCSPAHRATTRLLLEAVSRQPVRQRPAIWLEQSDLIDARSPEVAKINKDGGFVGWPQTAAATITYDASRRLPSGREAYDYVREARRAHATQFPDEAAGKVHLNPAASAKLVPLAPATSLTDEEYCDALNLRHPTLDTPEGRKLLGLD